MRLSIKSFLFTFTALVGTSMANAMPCDTGYLCRSASGKYEVELNRCRYVNDLRLGTLKINGKTVEGAELRSGWDGKSVGDNFLAFEISLPTTDDSLKVLSAEIGKNNMKGELKLKLMKYVPDTFKTLRTETISCEITN